MVSMNHLCFAFIEERKKNWFWIFIKKKFKLGTKTNLSYLFQGQLK